MGTDLPLHVDGDELLDAGSPTGTLRWTPLQYASAAGDMAMATALLQRDNTIVHQVGQTQTKYTSLHIAVQGGHKDLVKLLLDNGAIVDAADTRGFTPLHIAATMGLQDMVALLLERNAAQLPSKAGTLPIECAYARGFHEIVALLGPSTPSSTPPADTGVRAWLSFIGLGQYAHAFEQGGFDDLHFIHQIGLTTEDVVGLGVVKRGHQLKLKRLYQIERFIAHDDSDTHSSPSDESSDDSSDDEDGPA
ncbi:hypothetical protein H310_11595 [Aphanomyces invadans]|uniref:SAM domain-containing protein n=1 Tax=Aphanomyces invadans TaxID=157072 RepID=A0A024TNQ8_9STRA|nr:hypothetical protein H310_11595 [Aphanomyces invadans]ETV94952.1 hypothetical protein H310_11595 [Aphanomyces invadans]|eukprot:XP_008876543.1 hypothetical protein H310_11595 [Aphanomyces invadans]